MGARHNSRPMRLSRREGRVTRVAWGLAICQRSSHDNYAGEVLSGIYTGR